MAATRPGTAALISLTAIAFLAPQVALAADPHRARTCVKTIHVPAVTRTAHERVTIPGRTIDTIVAPRNSVTTRRVVTSSPRTRTLVHPPRYTTTHVSEREPDRIVERHIPVKTKQVRRKVMLHPARTVHKACMKHGHHTTCAVHIPPTYGYRTETVVTRHARVEHRRVRGRVVSRDHREQVAHGSIERIHVGTQYRDIHVATPEVPQHLRRHHVPARHTTVAREVIVTPAHVRKVHVPCGH